jgi:hypothetical protein
MLENEINQQIDQMNMMKNEIRNNSRINNINYTKDNAHIIQNKPYY